MGINDGVHVIVSRWLVVVLLLFSSLSTASTTHRTPLPVTYLFVNFGLVASIRRCRGLYARSVWTSSRTLSPPPAVSGPANTRVWTQTSYRYALVGHLHCERCLFNYIENLQDALQATCPTCRSEFSLGARACCSVCCRERTAYFKCTATPDLRVIPRKYQPYINPSLRRVYIPVDAAQGNSRLRIVQLEAMVDNLRLDKDRLMDRAESNIRKAQVVGEKEREAREENGKLKLEVRVLNHKNEELRAKYAAMKEKYKQLKHSVR